MNSGPRGHGHPPGAVRYRHQLGAGAQGDGLVPPQHHRPHRHGVGADGDHDNGPEGGVHHRPPGGKGVGGGAGGGGKDHPVGVVPVDEPPVAKHLKVHQVLVRGAGKDDIVDGEGKAVPALRGETGLDGVPFFPGTAAALQPQQVPVQFLRLDLGQEAQAAQVHPHHRFFCQGGVVGAVDHRAVPPDGEDEVTGGGSLFRPFRRPLHRADAHGGHGVPVLARRHGGHPHGLHPGAEFPQHLPSAGLGKIGHQQDAHAVTSRRLGRLSPGPGRRGTVPPPGRRRRGLPPGRGRPFAAAAGIRCSPPAPSPGRR